METHQSRASHQKLKEKLPNKFIQIRMKRLEYQSRGAVAIYIKDVSSKVRQKVIDIEAREL